MKVMTFFVRKDIARLLELSVVQVGRNEKNLGLVPIKVNRRVIRYASRAALRALAERNLLPPDAPTARTSVT
jgi:hypothetical protein